MSYAWIKSKTEAFEAVEFVQEVSGGKMEVRTAHGESMFLEPDELVGVLDDVSELHQAPDDLVMLDKIDEPSILQALRVRYSTDNIYTNIGDILISVNPFKQLPLYTPAVLQEFLNLQPSEMPPHVYAVAASAYHGLIDSEAHLDQSILISGESGAGKTEATKLVLSFLSEAAGSESGMIEQRILAANPILEAFGNAKTLRNNNSSRFGKFVQLRFDGRGKIVGCDTQHYLLEKTRIVQAGPRERSFHVFYQLCAGAEKALNPDHQDYDPNALGNELKQALEGYPASGDGRGRGASTQLQPGEPDAFGNATNMVRGAISKRKALQWDKTGLGLSAEAYPYLAGTGCTVVDGVDDLEEMTDLYAALVNLGLDPGERQNTLALTCSVLLLGQLKFEEKSGFAGGSKVVMEDETVVKALHKACEVMGLTTEQLTRVLTTRELVIRGEVQQIQQTPEQASDSKDALAKALYSANFDWVVARINKATQAVGNWAKVQRSIVRLARALKAGEISQERFYNGEFAQASIGNGIVGKKTTAGSNGMWEGTKSIGILDIFGFEIFEKNSFEQLCINYANERLQQLFNLSTFRAEEDAYRAEGVPFDPVLFADNQDVLDLIDKKPTGILPLLDEEVILPRTTDDTFLRKLGENHERKHKRYQRPKGNASRFSFGVLHYAGSVTYAVDGFLQKNKDELSPDIVAVLQTSTNVHVSKIFALPDSSGGTAAKSSADSKGNGDSRIRRMGSSGSNTGGGSAKKAVQTQGALFRRQVDDLMSTLGKTRSNFIRCIKPNTDKRPLYFQGAQTHEQLRCSGVFEAVTIRRQGYPSRLAHASFYRRYKTLASLSPDQSPLQALAMEPDAPAVPKDPRAACEVLLQVLAQQPGLARMPAECLMGKTMVLWRTDVNKAITLVRADVERKAAARIQSMARMKQGKAIAKTMNDLRAKLRHAMSYTGDNQDEVDEVEKLLKASDEAPFRVLEHKAMQEKFKVILKRRKVAASIDEMSSRTIDQVDDDFVNVCLAAKELEFDGPVALALYALYDQFTERLAALLAIRKAIETPRIDCASLEAALQHCQSLKPKYGEQFCAAEEKAAQEALRQVKTEEAALSCLAMVLENDALVAGDPRQYKAATAEENQAYVQAASSAAAAAALPNGVESDPNDDAGKALQGFPDLRLRSVMQLLAGNGAVANENLTDATCRTARGAALLPLGLFALKLRATYVDAIYEAVHGKNRPGSNASTVFSADNKSGNNNATNESAPAANRKGPSAGIMKLRMRTLESSLQQQHSAGGPGGAGGSGGDLLAASAKPDHAAWERCAPLVDDAKELFGDMLNDQSASSPAASGGGANRAPPPPPPGGEVRASVALLSGSTNAEGLSPMEAAELEAVRAALQADLKLVVSAKHYCALAIDSAFHALKEVPCSEARANEALTALAEVGTKYGPVGAAARTELEACLASIQREHATCQLLHSALHSGQLVEPVDEILPESINTGPLKVAAQSVQSLADTLHQTAKGRAVADATRLLQPQNQTLLRAALFVAKLRDAVQGALAIGDTTESSKFAEARVAWDGIQKLLLEATNVEGLHEVDLDDMTSARQLLLKRSVMSDVKEKLIEATKNQWEDWLEFSLFQAEQLGLDYHEDQEVRDVVTNARAVHADIKQTKQNLIDATAETGTRSPVKLQRAIEGARVLGWTNPKVDEAIAREAVVAKACNVAHNAWQQLDRRVIQAAVDECNACSVDSDDVGLCKYLLAGSEKAFLSKAHRLFLFLGRSDRVTDITMAMKDMFFENAGDMFALPYYPGLRKPEDYGRASSSMGFKCTESSEGMLKWCMKLHTSLTIMELVPKNAKQNDLEVKKLVKQIWQCVQGYMGDITFSYPSMLAQEILRVALEYPVLKDEIYCILLKQVTANPNPSSEAKGLDLLQICLQSFSPSDLLVNYLEYSLRAMNQDGLVRQLHLMSAEANLQDKQLSLAEIGKVTGLQVHSGWLQLRSEGVFNSYTRYWFLMDPEAGKLRYFLQEGSGGNLKQKQLNCVDVGQMSSLVELEPSDKASRNPSIRGKFPFEMGLAGKKKLRLVSDTAEDRDLWMQALRAAKNASWTRGDGAE